MSKKSAYELDEPTRVEIPDPLTGERNPISFPAGAVVPKSEQELAALEHCVNLGIATSPDGRRMTYPVPAPEEPEDAPAAPEPAPETSVEE